MLRNWEIFLIGALTMIAGWLLTLLRLLAPVGD
jgi:hypothetical protein